jgi:hypothetical protein
MKLVKKIIFYATLFGSMLFVCISVVASVRKKIDAFSLPSLFGVQNESERESSKSAVKSSVAESKAAAEFSVAHSLAGEIPAAYFALNNSMTIDALNSGAAAYRLENAEKSRAQENPDYITSTQRTTTRTTTSVNRSVEIERTLQSVLTPSLRTGVYGGVLAKQYPHAYERFGAVMR